MVCLQVRNGFPNLGPLLLGIVQREVGMGLAMSSDLEPFDAEQVVDLLFVSLDPFAGQKEGGGNPMRNQIVQQGLVEAGPVFDRAEIEGQCHPWAMWRTGPDDLGLSGENAEWAADGQEAGQRDTEPSYHVR